MDATTYIPVWRTPHEFVSFSGGRVRTVATWGLVALGLTGVRHAGGARRAGETIGFEWLAATADRLRGGEESELTRFLKDEFWLGVPNRRHQYRARPGTISSDGAVPDEIMSRFADKEGALIASWASNAFGGLDSRLPEIARARTKVPGVNYLQVAQARLAHLEPPLAYRPHALTDSGGRSFYTVNYYDLVERAALEFFDLAALSPRIRLCKRCGRPFVQTMRRGQTGCPNNIWDTLTWELVEHCGPVSTHDDEGARLRERERKRLHQNWRRMTKQHGADHPKTLEAEGKWRVWKEANPSPRPRGRPETPWQPELYEDMKGGTDG